MSSSALRCFLSRARRARRGGRAALVLLAALLCAGVGSAVPSRAADDPPGSYYAASFGRSEGQIVFVHYWSKGKRLRSETVLQGQPIVTIVSGDTYYCYNPQSGEGYAIKRDKAAVKQAGKRSRPFGNEMHALLDAGGEKVRSEKFGDVDVDVYRVTTDDGRRTLWVMTQEHAIPLRMETYERRTGRTSQLDWVNWIPDIALDDDFFAPPDGLKLRRFGSYQDYLEALAKDPIPPMLPLFTDLVRAPKQ